MDLYHQYLELKRQHPDTILFFRIGEFYEAFGDDARTVARELQVTLTSRPMEPGIRVPMAGLPSHSLDLGLARLIARGHKLAVAEQLREIPTTCAPAAGSPIGDATSPEISDPALQLSLPFRDTPAPI